jgi:hypothetical protein
MTKTDQIRILLRQGKSTREVAMEVFSLDEKAPTKVIETRIAYVRTARLRSPDYVSTDTKAKQIVDLFRGAGGQNGTRGCNDSLGA